MQIQRIPLTELEPNTGQIPGLPSNPRQWTKSDVERIARSLRETPELFEARPIIAVPYNGDFVILGGNLRYEGARKNGDATAPTIVLPEDTPTEKLKEIVIKDNGTFGQWDTDALANEWSDLLLEDWGVPDWVTGGTKREWDSIGEGGEMPEPPDERIKIQVILPHDLEDRRDEIRDLVRVAVEGYEGIQVK